MPELKTQGLVQARYLPVYDSRTADFNTYYCHPERLFEGEGIVEGSALLGRGVAEKKVDTTLALENMLGTIRLGCEKAQELVYTGSNAKVIVPINGTALTHIDISSEFTQFCKGFPEVVLQGLVFEVTNVTDSAAMSFLDELAIILYLFCCTYSCRISPMTKEYSYYATCNYTGVSFSLGNRVLPLDKLTPLLARIFERAESARLKVYLHGVPDQGTREAVEAAGIRYFDGDGVQPTD